LVESNNPTVHHYAVFCGLDVGKEVHHACALDPAGAKLHDKALPNDEAALIEVYTRLSTHGPVLVIVDQPASIGALSIAVARSLGIEVAYLPGLAMRRIADLHPGEGKTDARDAYVIADAARTMPHTLRRVGTDDETLAGLTVLAGYDDDLAAQSTRLTNRLRDALLHVHPALERLLGKHIDRGGVLDLLAAAATPSSCAPSACRASRPPCVRGLRGWLRRCPPRSCSLWMHRTSPCPAPASSDVSSPESPPSFARSTPNAPRWPPTSKRGWRPTLLPRS